MTFTAPHSSKQKLTWVYSDHRKRHVLYCVKYAVEHRRGCKVYTIQRLDELE